jgi:hypothetical protein
MFRERGENIRKRKVEKIGRRLVSALAALRWFTLRNEVIVTELLRLIKKGSYKFIVQRCMSPPMPSKHSWTLGPLSAHSDISVEGSRSDIISDIGLTFLATSIPDSGVRIVLVFMVLVWRAAYAPADRQSVGVYFTPTDRQPSWGCTPPPLYSPCI